MLGVVVGEDSLLWRVSSQILVSEVGLLFNGLHKRLKRKHVYNYRI